MPWPPEQRKAIAARMNREGKSRDEITRFFHKHGHGRKKKSARHDMYAKFIRKHGH